MLLYLLPTGRCQEVVSDSTWITVANGQVTEWREIAYDNNTGTTFRRAMGSVADYTLLQRNLTLSEAANAAREMEAARRIRRDMAEKVRALNALSSVLGTSPADSVRATKSDLLATTGWRIDATGFRFRRTAQGVFQWRADTATTWRAAAYLGGVIILNGLNGYNTHFYQRGNNGRWVTPDQRHVIRDPGTQDAAPRSALAPPPIQQQDADQPAIERIEGERDLAFVVKAVHDGDSYKIDWPDMPDWIRVAGIDCPEVISNKITADQPYGRFVADTLRKMLKGDTIVINFIGFDRLDRPLVTVQWKGKDLAEVILRNGWAHYYSTRSLPASKRKSYQAARDAAKRAKRGIWSQKEVINPADWRRQNWKQ